MFIFTYQIIDQAKVDSDTDTQNEEVGGVALPHTLGRTAGVFHSLLQPCAILVGDLARTHRFLAQSSS